MSDSDHIFQVDDLSVMRGDAVLCQNLSLSLGGGRLQIIRGANGSGKSTLLKTLAGLRRPQAGNVRWGGVPIAEHPQYPQLVCYVGHQHGLKLEMTVRDNLAFFAKMFGQESLLNVALHYFGLGPIAHLPAGHLSAGWLQRLKLAKLVCSPALLWLLDEPSSNLDQAGLELLLSLVSARLDRGGVIVMATHAKIEGLEAQEIVMGARN